MRRWPIALLGAAWLSLAAAQDLPVARAPNVALTMRAGATLESVLAALNSQGHHIVYSSALVTSNMTLRAAPRARRIDMLLAEILAPWQLRAIPGDEGGWLIVAAPVAPPAARNAAESAEVPEIETIDVTASRYALATPGSSRVFLDRRGVEQMPHLADDAVRMLKVMPGVSGGDFSAALNIRGGRREETLLRIDGAEIHNGFHFRDLDGALSVLDTNLVDSIDFISGGMTAEYGDYMSGVVDMRTRRPRADDEYRSAAGVSFVSAYGRTGGTFAEGRGSWLASARRGYLDVVMERVQSDDEQITPRYTDVFASLFYDFGESSSVSAHVLLGQDDLRLVSHDDDDVESAGKGNAAHFWVTLKQGIGALRAETVLSASTVRQQRDSFGEEEQRTGDVDADFRFRFLDLRSDWSWNFSERQALLFGANAGRTQADYEYALVGTKISPAAGGWVDIDYAHDLDLSGDEFGAHVAWRGRLARDLVVEAGARWDQYGYPDGRRFSAVSPRLNAVYGVGERGELRAAWGVVHQPHGIHELQVEDDLTEFFAPERVRQAVLGYGHHFEHGWSARVDVYRKDYSRQRPRFENALDSLQLIPEGGVDRVRIDAPEALAAGVELTLRREAERGFAGWASLAFAKTEENVVGEGWAPRLWDQRRGLSMGLSWTGAKWNFNVAGLYHSGAPTTSLRQASISTPGGPQDVIVAGKRNGARLGDYARFDLRANRSVQMRNVRLNYYLEVTNFLNRENPCCMESYSLESDQNGRVRLQLEETSWLPMLPSFGFQFEF
ncbi:MAG TPA: TonB-dependent receptor plug domain-containing protein [Steroidobacteraceae bacterium]|nr:TonB-dependent receptor plug domain-containing protein [Steroidobacteraceae bacterium]